MTGPRIGAEYPYVLTGLPSTNACRPAAILSETAFPCFAASTSRGMGKGVLNCDARGSAIRQPAMLADVIAAAPIANWRRVNMVISLVRHLCVSSGANHSFAN